VAAKASEVTDVFDSSGREDEIGAAPGSRDHDAFMPLMAKAAAVINPNASNHPAREFRFDFFFFAIASSELGVHESERSR